MVGPCSGLTVNGMWLRYWIPKLNGYLIDVNPGLPYKRSRVNVYS